MILKEFDMRPLLQNDKIRLEPFATWLEGGQRFAE
jgi:hypothetical protein